MTDLATSPTRCLVVLSGGADSAICLHWALLRFEVAEALTFDYGQRHRNEITCARRIAMRLGVPHRVLPINSFAALGGNSLVDTDLPVRSQEAGQLPNTFVPGRNLIFITLAAARAYGLGVRDLVTGVCQTDYSGYPDCRATTMQALEKTLGLGMDAEFRIHTPLMQLTKAESVRLAYAIGAFPSLALSLTCYEGRQPACGICPSCVLRAKGFAEAGLPDPLLATS